MPNDASEQDKISQRSHGDRMRFERNLMKETGLTRSQVRQRLAKAAEALKQQQRLQNAATTVNAIRRGTNVSVLPLGGGGAGADAKGVGAIPGEMPFNQVEMIVAIDRVPFVGVGPFTPLYEITQ